MAQQLPNGRSVFFFREGFALEHPELARPESASHYIDHLNPTYRNVGQVKENLESLAIAPGEDTRIMLLFAPDVPYQQARLEIPVEASDTSDTVTYVLTMQKQVGRIAERGELQWGGMWSAPFSSEPIPVTEAPPNEQIAKMN